MPLKALDYKIAKEKQILIESLEENKREGWWWDGVEW